MSFPKYGAYVDSGVEWLGELPAHWGCARFKWEIERNDGGVWGDDPDGENDTVVLRSTEQTVDGRWRIEDPATRKLTDSDRVSSLLLEGDLVVTKASGSALHIGKTTIVTPDIASMGCCFSNFMQRVRVKEGYSPLVAWYFMNNVLARVQFDLMSSSTTGLANLNGTIIGDIMLPAPPPEEQAAIADFLDRETAKIDALIAEQERLIALLKEKRQATISYAVTKGLDPNAPMKDSGVEWLGEVPAHWRVVRLGTIFREAIGSGDENLPVLSVSIHSGVSDREFDDEELDRKVTRSEDRSKYKKVEPDDLVYNMMRAWQGGFGTVSVVGLVSPAYIVARPRGESVTGFVEHLLRTRRAVEEIRRHSRGITDFRLRLYWAEFKDIRIGLPPLLEQGSIMAAIERDLTVSGSLEREAEVAISLLRERRSALISAAITGKIDVRSPAPSAAEAA